ncbi:MAG: S8 family serine peptidase [Phototrophicaceae bacterium]
MNKIKVEPPQFIANYPNYGIHPLLSVRDRLSVKTQLTGKGVTIAYLDAGFYMHPDIADRVAVHVDATTPDILEAETVNHVDVTSWHGLMVSAIGSGDGHLSDGYYRGLAFESNLVLIKVSNPQLQVKESDILRGFEWLVENHQRFNIRVVNVSVGGDKVSKDPKHPLHQCVKQLVEAGVAVVIASGNRETRRLVPPASAPEAIIVGGYNDNNSADSQYWYGYHSNYGQAYNGMRKPDLIAPAEWIPSPILPETFVEKEAKWLGALLNQVNSQTAIEDIINKGYDDLNISEERAKEADIVLYQDFQNRIFAHKLISRYYQYVDGTSVAAPIVSATIALMVQANPNLTVDQIRSSLQQSALPLETISSEQQGAGALQVDKAIQQAIQQRH